MCNKIKFKSKERVKREKPHGLFHGFAADKNCILANKKQISIETILLDFTFNIFSCSVSPQFILKINMNNLNPGSSSREASEMELEQLRQMPPALILRSGGDKIFIPLPCQSKMCR